MTAALGGLVTLLLAGPAYAADQATPTPLTRVTVEVFAVGLAEGEPARIVFARQEGALEGGANRWTCA